MRSAGALDKKSRCVSSAIAFTVTGPTSFVLPIALPRCRPPTSGAPRQAGWRAGFRGGRTARPRPGEGPRRRIPAAFYWHPCRNCARVASMRGPNLLSAWDNETYRAMRLALYQPDIPQNTGTILRLCGCLGIEAHIIAPAGFPTSDRAFRRAGMDYLDAVTIVRHASWRDFEAWRAAGR